MPALSVFFACLPLRVGLFFGRMSRPMPASRVFTFRPGRRAPSPLRFRSRPALIETARRECIRRPRALIIEPAGVSFVRDASEQSEVSGNRSAEVTRHIVVPNEERCNEIAHQIRFNRSICSEDLDSFAHLARVADMQHRSV